MTCDVARCQGTAAIHVLFRAGGNTGTAAVCRPCLLSVLAGCAVALGHRAAHVADHPLAPQCRHPDSRWVDDHCEVPGLELLDLTDINVEVPA